MSYRRVKEAKAFQFLIHLCSIFQWAHRAIGIWCGLYPLDKLHFANIWSFSIIIDLVRGWEKGSVPYWPP